MTCGSCEAKVKSALMTIEDVIAVEVSKYDNSATITMNNNIALSDFQKVLDSKYQISVINNSKNDTSLSFGEGLEGGLSWLETYKPILLIFFYISLVTILINFNFGHINYMLAMQHFMAGFFLVFSFFKLLNLKGFAESYRMYDVIAKQVPVWGYVYAIIELGLGIAYLINFNPLITNWITFVVMIISVIGVVQSVLDKKKIQCGCLGTIFNLPMSTITIIEDILMIAMSGFMIITLS